MTHKSDCNHQLQSTGQPTNSNWTTSEREKVETLIYQIHEGLVKSWIPLYVSAKLRELIDTDQLTLEILRKLMEAIWRRGDAIKFDREKAKLLCWTITKRRSLNFVRDARTLKRLTEFVEIRPETIGELPDQKISSRHDLVAEYNDLQRVVFASLEPQYQRILELKLGGLSFVKIAVELGMTISKLKSIRKKIVQIARPIMEGWNPSAIRRETRDERRETRLEQIVSRILKKFRFFFSEACAFGDLYG